MKKIKILLLFMSLCAVGANGEQVEVHPEAFVGVWQGTHFESGSIEKRSWVQHRRADGTYTIIFKMFRGDRMVSMNKVEGRWWVVENFFFEQGGDWVLDLHVYYAEVLSEDIIKFTRAHEDYVMVDTRTDELAFETFKKALDDWEKEREGTFKPFPLDPSPNRLEKNI